jgi:hypothetical protein
MPAIRRSFKPRQAAIPKSNGGERCGRAGTSSGRRHAEKKGSASEPLLMCRNGQITSAALPLVLSHKLSDECFVAPDFNFRVASKKPACISESRRIILKGLRDRA